MTTIFSPNTRTTDATQTQAQASMMIPEDCVGRLVVDVYATNHAGEASRWRYTALVRRVGSNAPTMVSQTSERQNSAGAASWAASPRLDGNQIVVDVTGAAAVTVDWGWNSDGSELLVGPLNQ